MLAIPAIDLQNGQCVRLQQGQFDRSTIYQSLPEQLAKRYASLGTKRLHVVDLDGACLGTTQQLNLIETMQSPTMSIQVGGGIRSIAAAQRCLAARISTLVIGSIAISDPALTLQIITEVGANRIVLALDVHIKNGTPCPAINGWQTPTKRNAWDVVQFYQDAGVASVLCTDIAQDGMMQGPNFQLYKEAMRRFPTIAWQASGGVRNMNDMRTLSTIGISAVILGRILYEPDFNLSACLQEFASC